MEIAMTTAGDAATVRVSGRLDARNADILSRELDECVRGGQRVLRMAIPCVRRLLQPLLPLARLPEHDHRVRITRCGSFTGLFHQAPPPFILMAIFKKEAVIGLNQAKHGIQAPLFGRPFVPLARLVAHDRPIPQAQKFPHVILRRCVTRFCRNQESLERLLSPLLIIKYEPFALFALNLRLNLRGSRTNKQAQPNPQYSSLHQPHSFSQ